MKKLAAICFAVAGLFLLSSCAPIYELLGMKVETPVITPPGGTYSAPQQVTILCDRAGATIHYTVDGTTPGTKSRIYSGPIPIDATTTLQAIAVAKQMADSDVARAVFTIEIPDSAAAPTFDPPGGTYYVAQYVTLTTATQGAEIRYTTGAGQQPGASSTLYEGPFLVSTGTTVRAIAIKAELANSSVASAAYSFAVAARYAMTAKWGSDTSSAGVFNYPTSIAVDSSGNVFVADTNNHRIKKYDPSGNLALTWGSYGSGNGNFFCPTGIALNPAETELYVSDTYNYRIQVFQASDGQFLRKWGSFGDVTDDVSGSMNGKFQGATGVAVAPNGDVYVADSSNSRIQKFSSTGTFLTKWGVYGTPYDPSDGNLHQPYGIAVDSAGYVYVSDQYDNFQLQKFDANGGFVKKWFSFYDGISRAHNQHGIALDSGGNLYLCDTYYRRVVKADLTVDPPAVTVLAAEGEGDGQVIDPYGVALDPQGNVYIVDRRGSRVQKLAANGSYIKDIGATTMFAGGSLDHPYGIARDGSGNFYVADVANNRIQKYDPSGNFLTGWGTYGSANGQFSSPKAIAVDASGRVYVADSGNDRVQRFSASGVFSAKWGSTGTGNGQFDNPSGIVVNPSGDIYVADAGNNRIQKFSSAGAFILAWGAAGSADGQLSNPNNLALDAAGHVFVADTNNSRIQEFMADGTFMASFGSQGSASGQFSVPWGVAVDASGDLYIADTGNRRVQKILMATGDVIAWGSMGSADGKFFNPIQVVVDPLGTVYVTDSYNNRIQAFSPGL